MTRDKHPLAGQTVRIASKDPSLDGLKYVIEDWWVNVSGGTSWGEMRGNPACLKYAFRAGLAGLPSDDEVVYGKIGAFGELLHRKELGAVVTPKFAMGGAG